MNCLYCKHSLYCEGCHERKITHYYCSLDGQKKKKELIETRRILN